MSQFKYLFFVAGANGKRELCRLDTVEEKIEKSNKTDIFTSLFYYNNEVVTYFQKNSTSKGFRGTMFSPHLVFDIDSSLHQSVELNIIDAIEKQKHLLEDLKSKGIINYRISFSSSKGFHTVIPSEIFGNFEPSSSLPAQLLALAKQITTADFDKSIFSNLRIFRVINTKSSKSGLYKIPITEGLLNYPDKILELAKSPQEASPIKKQEPVKALVRLKERAFDLVPEEHIFSGTYNKKPKNKLCILKLLQGVDTGERNEALCRITSHFKQEGYTPEFAFELILSWNKFNKQQESIEVLKNTFESIWNGGYSYGCFDYLLDSYCDQSCYLYRTKVSKEESQDESEFPIYSILDTQRFYEKFVKEDRRIKLGISEKIDTLIKGMAPQEIGVILGRPTAGKSTLAMHMGYNFVKNYGGCFLYISLEMSLAMMYERQMQIILGQNSDYIEKNYPSFAHDEDLKRFLVSDRTNISVKQIKKAVLDYQDKSGDKIEFIVVDYLHAMKSDGQDERTKINQTVQDLTALAKELDTRLLYLAHVHRTFSKEDSVYLPVKMGDGRDSSTIENSAFYIFAAHLIRDDPNVVMFQLLKNKNGMPFPSGVRLIRENNSLQLKEEKLTINLEDL
ncbi:MAG: AAA family ATPase [Candidatus Moranbacteria bacterium]|nr:AAA family ATPase [Candidatus Moranbacteria bacterium]